MRAALPLSAAGHAAILALLFLLPAAAPAPPQIDLSNAIALVFTPSPAMATPPAPAPAAPEPPAPAIASELTPPPVEQASTPLAEVPQPLPKPAPKPRPRPTQAVEPPARQWPLPMSPQAPATPGTTPAGGTQVASIPSPPPGPTISADYRTVLSGWLEAHKHYPEEARQRGEQGRAVLRFRVDRHGRVLDYTIVGSTGYTDLDAAVQNMMRGATLPPFPASMTEPEIEVSVAVRFGLAR